MGSRTPAAIAANHESCFVGSRLRTDDLFRIVCSTAVVDAGARASNAIFILVVTKLARIIEEVAKFLPEQAPLHTFVHHNTLHAFEHMGFDEAVVAASELFGTEPYLSEAAFAEHVRSGRIQAVDLEAVLDAEVRSEARALTQEQRRRRLLRLQRYFEVPRGAALTWHLTETDVLERVHPLVDDARRRAIEALAEGALRQLWLSLVDAAHGMLAERLSQERAAVAAAAGRTRHERRTRRRDQFLALHATDAKPIADIDVHVHPLVIRTCAAFLDQGVATWPMPERERGYLSAFRRLYGQPGHTLGAWAQGLARELREQEAAGLDAIETLARALNMLGIAEEQWHDSVLAALLPLKGWAGMMRQFEVRPDRAPVEARPARLVDFAAVLLTCEAFASRWVLRERFGPGAAWTELEAALPPQSVVDPRVLAFEGFVMAQVSDADLMALSERATATGFLQDLADFDEVARRRVLHAAYERRLRIRLLDGLASQAKAATQATTHDFQAILCIDDRACSLRRHLEEVLPSVETFGYAGFFGVAMAWQGLGEVQARPLCPVNVVPRHYVTERALEPEEEAAWRRRRRRRGLATKVVTQHGHAATGGGLLSTIFGWWSLLPMVGRCLMPRFSERALRGFVDPANIEPVTSLVFEREGEARDAAGRYIGYSAGEMADVVEGLLRSIGLTRGFSDVVCVVGHGSSSFNNPHEAAYDCGATGGGGGGPHARGFAAMANHADVRVLLRERGIEVPATTRFVAGYHNTCDDSMTWYDEDRIPKASVQAFSRVRAVFEEACERDAHERCRRFVSAPHGTDAKAALRHAQGRAVDLAQPRPECGHATNAFAIVGRRERTRGLFLDRRAFLVSYDPTTDANGDVLEGLLRAVVPVGAGINLEYYFSFVDPRGYGCGTKLPHNITGLIGVMDGHASDLRTGLPWQMVEIHEPVRLLTVVDAEPRVLESVLARNEELLRLVQNGWIRVVAWSPGDGRLHDFVESRFEAYVPETASLPIVASSAQFYGDERGHLGLARIANPALSNGEAWVGGGPAS